MIVKKKFSKCKYICIYKKKCVILQKFSTMQPDSIKLYEAAELLCCSVTTAQRRLAEMRKALNMPKWSKLSKAEIIDFFNLGTKG